MKSVKVGDVVVVGAGLAGTLIARRLAEENQRVTVLEATDTIGGNSIRSIGVALLGTPEPYPVLADRLGEDLAAQVWMLTQKNLEALRRTAQNIGVQVSKVGSFRLTDRSDEALLLQKAATMLNEIGIDATLEDATDKGFLVGLRTAEDLAFNPKELVESLIDHPNIDVHTGTEVQRLMHQSETLRADDVAIWAHKYYSRAETVILASGAYTLHRHQELGRFMHPQLIQAIDCDAMSTSTLPLILPGDAHNQVIAKNSATTLRMVTWAETHKQGWRILTQAAESLCRNASLRGRWSGWTVQSEDRLPVIGEIPGLPGVYIVNGLGTWGLSWAFIAADLLVALILQDQQPSHLDLNRLYP
jgi:tRNA 5-methylaminomethyl-2-thiouridine biosynthesis bifunctional protein